MSNKNNKESLTSSLRGSVDSPLSIKMSPSTSAETVDYRSGGGSITSNARVSTRDPVINLLGNTLDSVSAISKVLEEKDQKTALKQAQADTVGVGTWKEIKMKQGAKIAKEKGLEAPEEFSEDEWSHATLLMGEDWYNNLNDHQIRAYDNQLAINHGDRFKRLLKKHLTESGANNMSQGDYDQTVKDFLDNDYENSLKNQTDSFRAISSTRVEEFLSKHADLKTEQVILQNKEDKLTAYRESLTNDFESLNVFKATGNKEWDKGRKEGLEDNFNGIRARLKTNLGGAYSNKEVDKVFKDSLLAAVSTAKVDPDVAKEILHSKRWDLAKTKITTDLDTGEESIKHEEGSLIASYADTDPSVVKAVVAGWRTSRLLKEERKRQSDMDSADVTQAMYSELQSLQYQADNADNDKAKAKLEEQAKDLMGRIMTSDASDGITISIKRQIQAEEAKSASNGTSQRVNRSNLNSVRASTLNTLANMYVLDNKFDKTSALKAKIITDHINRSLTKSIQDNPNQSLEEFRATTDEIINNFDTNSKHYNDKGQLGFTVKVRSYNETTKKFEEEELFVNPTVRDIITSPDFETLDPEIQKQFKSTLDARNTEIDILHSRYDTFKGIPTFLQNDEQSTQYTESILRSLKSSSNHLKRVKYIKAKEEEENRDINMQTTARVMTTLTPNQAILYHSKLGAESSRYKTEEYVFAMITSKLIKDIETGVSDSEEATNNDDIKVMEALKEREFKERRAYKPRWW